MRMTNSIINGLIGISTQVILICISFITRKLFIYYIGVEILGINGLFSNILNMLNLAELGIGTVITFYLYKPIAEADENQICALMFIYKKIYFCIGIFVALTGTILMFFIPTMIKVDGKDLNFLRNIFLLQLISTVSSYFFAHKRTLLYAYQKQYLVNLYDTLIYCFISILQLIGLVIYKNYYLYLFIQIIQVLLSNIVIYYKCNKKYPFLKNKIKDNNYDFKIMSKLKDVFVGKLAGYVYNSTDNIIISLFVGITQVGILSNYVLIATSVQGLIGKLTLPVQAAIGNLLNQDVEKNKVFQILEVYTFVRFIIVSFAYITVIILIQPFITLWIGKEYLMSIRIIILISINIFIGSIQGPLGEYINALGLFKWDKWICVLGTITNLLFSLILVRFIGIEGVLLGTVISQIIFWIGRVYVVLHLHFKISISTYIYKVATYITMCVVNLLITFIVSNTLFENYNIMSIMMRLIVCVSIPNIINVIVFRKSDEYKYLQNTLIGLFSVNKRNIKNVQ